VLCGRNRRLRAELAEVPGVVALGWRSDVPELMASVDVLVHNAGGLSVTEALTAGCRPSPTGRSRHGTANRPSWPRPAWRRAEDPEELAEVVREHASLRSEPSAVIREQTRPPRCSICSSRKTRRTGRRGVPPEAQEADGRVGGAMTLTIAWRCSLRCASGWRRCCSTTARCGRVAGRCCTRG